MTNFIYVSSLTGNRFINKNHIHKDFFHHLSKVSTILTIIVVLVTPDRHLRGTGCELTPFCNFYPYIVDLGINRFFGLGHHLQA